MKRALMKKHIFMVLFLLLLGIFSVANFAQVRRPLLKAVMDTSVIEEEGLGAYVRQVEKVTENHVAFKLYFVEMYGFLQKLMDKKEINQFQVVSDENGYLNYAEFYEDPDHQIAEYAKRIRRLQDAAKEKECEVFFVNPIQKNVRGVTQTNEGFPIADYNLVQDEFLKELADNGVAFLDTRRTLEQYDLPYEDMFFKTDHHWTGQTAFLVFRDIVDFMNERYQAGLDPTGYYRNVNHYRLERYKGCMLGSMGRDTGVLYAGLEDILLIYPDFPSDIVYTRIMDSGDTSIQSGSIRDTLISQEEIDSTDIYHNSKYGMYLEELTSAEIILNKKNPDGPKILCIRDSYFSPCMEFLTPLCSEIHAIWALGDAPGYEIEDYVRTHAFDYIIVELYPGNLEEAAFPYFEEPVRKTKVEETP